ncbi:MAG: hypothetical protein ABEH38_03300 [Flavobacteriales bacterium]
MRSPSKKEKLTRSGLRSRLNLPVSIDDLRDKEFAGNSLSKEEKRALENFDRFRVEYLEKAQDDEDFQRRYFQLRSWANLHSYEEFL